MGVCLEDGADFEPYIEQVMEAGCDFSCCRELYDERKFDGDKPACLKFESSIVSDDELIQLDIEQSLDIIDGSDEKARMNALFRIEFYTRNGNKQDVGYRLLDRLISRNPAQNIGEAHFVSEIIKTVLIMEQTPRIVEGLMEVIRKTPSNNTTRVIYNTIFEGFRRYPYKMISEPLMDWMYSSQCSPRLKARVDEILEYAAWVDR